MTTIGDRIKSIRESRGLSQAELGEAVGKVGNGKPLSQQAIAAIEKDEIKNPRRLLDIAKALNVSEAYLRFGSTPEPNAKESEYTMVEAESDDWDKTEFAFLDKLDVRVRGGHGEAGGIEVVQKRLPFLRSTLRAAGVPAEAAKLVELSGNSMEP